VASCIEVMLSLAIGFLAFLERLDENGANRAGPGAEEQRSSLYCIAVLGPPTTPVNGEIWYFASQHSRCATALRAARLAEFQPFAILASPTASLSERTGPEP
jgi:hypothetical protein